jgi:uncharacterized SAM-binding protein YcdF (DUF218 family)
METLFFAVAKSVWALIRPETLLLALFAIAVLLGRLRFRRASVRTGTLALVLALVIAVLPVARLLYAPLEARHPARPQVDAPVGILVLGGGEELGPARGRGLPQVNEAGERYLAAIALAHAHPEARVMFAGGAATLSGGTGRNAEMSARVFEEAGIDPARLVLETSSRNTAENAANALALRPAGTEAGPWLLVTSAWHMPRALGTFCAAGWEGLVPWPTDFRSGPLDLGFNFALHLRELNTAAKEWVGLLGYHATGRTEQLLPEGCPP